MKCLYVINYNSVLANVYQDVKSTLLDYFLCSRLSTANDTFYVLITHLFRHAGGTLVSSQNDADDREIEKTLFTEVKYNLLQLSLDPYNFFVVQLIRISYLQLIRLVCLSFNNYLSLISVDSYRCSGVASFPHKMGH